MSKQRKKKTRSNDGHLPRRSPRSKTPHVSSTQIVTRTRSSSSHSNGRNPPAAAAVADVAVKHRTNCRSQSPPRKRQRKASLKLKESRMQEYEEQLLTSLLKNHTRRSTSVHRRRKTIQQGENLKSAPPVTKEISNKNHDGTSTCTSKQSNLDHEGEEQDMVCCICRCSVDYSEKGQFYWRPPALEQLRRHDTTEDNSAAAGRSSDVGDSEISENNGCKIRKYGQYNHICHLNMMDGKITATSSMVSSSNPDKESSFMTQSFNQNDDDVTQDSDYYGIKLPMDAYDANNALVICDGEGCNRCFHQRCHFIPLLSLPRGKWYCLICQIKAKEKERKGEKKKNKKHKSHDGKQKNDNAKILASVKDVGEKLHETLPLTIDELDEIYRVPCVKMEYHTQADVAKLVGIEGTTNNTNKAKQNNNNYNKHKQIEIVQQSIFSLENRFEYHSAPMKAELLRKGSQQLVKTIDHHLSSIRLCQNSIRTLTEANHRARNALVEKYSRTQQLPQELVQNVRRLAYCKLKLRQVMHTLQFVIRNKDDRKYLDEWYNKVKMVGTFSPGRVCTPKDRDPPVPAVISLETTEIMDKDSADNQGHELDIDVLGKKLFFGNPARQEPRFDIKDYDADADDDGDKSSESDDPTNKIRCCMCFSGHVEDENDVVMCDGQYCFRAFHMKCCAPHVTQKMLDDDENGVWFCPYCVCFAKTLHYIENEYVSHDMEDDMSKSSWENAEDVFPEAFSELEAADKWKVAKRDDISDKILADILGIDIRKELPTNEEAQGDDDDESDATFVSKAISVLSNRSSEYDSDDLSGVEWQVEKSELSALSCSDDESSAGDEASITNDETNVQEKTAQRKSKRLQKIGIHNKKTLEHSKNNADLGALDTSNIVHGKRTRAKVDYNRLNESMFGKVKSSSIDDDEEYNLAVDDCDNDSCDSNEEAHESD